MRDPFEPLSDIFGAGEVTPRRNNGRGRVKGYAEWRPQRRTRIVMGQVQEILTEYRAHLPLTARQIFYRLVGAYDYSKTENAYDNLANYLNRARRAGMIPFESIRDDGISHVSPEHFADENAYYRRMRQEGQRFEIDKLAHQEFDMRVYCEAAGMMPQLARVLKGFSVPVYSCSGFDSTTAKYDLARECMETHTYQGKDTVILHLGDYDPSGEAIFGSIRDDVHAFLDDDIPFVEPEEVAKFERVALSAQQVRDHNLPTSPPKRTDSRTRRWEGNETCQLEAVPPDELALLLAESVAMHFDLGVLSRDREDEISARRNIMRALPGGAA